jgi:hypothetical protein
MLLRRYLQHCVYNVTKSSHKELIKLRKQNFCKTSQTQPEVNTILQPVKKDTNDSLKIVECIKTGLVCSVATVVVPCYMLSGFWLLFGLNPFPLMAWGFVNGFIN